MTTDIHEDVERVATLLRDRLGYDPGVSLGILEGMGPSKPGITAFQSAKAWHGVTVWFFDRGRRICSTIASREALAQFFAAIDRGVHPLDALADSDASGGWSTRKSFRHAPPGTIDPKRGWK